MRIIVLLGILSLPALSAFTLPQGSFSITERRIHSLPEGIDPASVAIDAEGSHIAYPVASGDSVAVALDGLPGEVYDRIENLRFVEGARLLILRLRG
jgi:hypothetical protein